VIWADIPTTLFESFPIYATVPFIPFEVVLVVQPKMTEPSPGANDQAGWSSDYFDLAGSIDDETFIRPPQGELPKPVEMA
jgi:hypothetical protein